MPFWKRKRRGPASPQRVKISGNGSFSFEIVGESFYQENIESVCGPKCQDGHEHYCKAVLRHEPNNPHDTNAVAVLIDGRKVGHIDRSSAARMAAAMNGQEVEVDAVIVGGWKRPGGSEGHFGVKLDL